MEWLISDPHFGHKNIQKFEPSRQQFGTVEDMDEAIIQRYNDTVNEGDTVFWLGDMFFCSSERQRYIVSKLKPTRNILILGNHDGGISKSKFNKLGFYPVRWYQYRNALLTHQPISDTNMRHLIEMGIHYNIHGHVHSAIEGFNPKTHYCVSVENTDFRPVHWDELGSIRRP